MNWELVARGAACYPDPFSDSRAVVVFGTWLIFFSPKVASIVAFCSIYLGLMTITAVIATFHNEPDLVDYELTCSLQSVLCRGFDRQPQKWRINGVVSRNSIETSATSRPN
jgi:hypothetical protein